LLDSWSFNGYYSAVSVDVQRGTRLDDGYYMGWYVRIYESVVNGDVHIRKSLSYLRVFSEIGCFFVIWRLFQTCVINPAGIWNVASFIYSYTEVSAGSFITYILFTWGRAVATNRQVAGSIPDGVIGIFQ
jgi:hypothetical protein